MGMPHADSGAGVADGREDARRSSCPPDDAVGDICFAALVRDTTGQLSESGDVGGLRRTRPTPPFFRGCSVGPARAAADGWARWRALALAALAAPAPARADPLTT